MNYSLHYKRLIDRAKNRVLDGYVERHHILPRCVWGEDSDANIAVLTAREHLISHLLLEKMFPNEQGLSYAAWMMYNFFGGKKISSRVYARLRAAFGEKIRRIHKGRKRSKETCEKLRLANLGKKASPEAREKMRLSHLGKKASQAQLDKMSVIGKNISQETREKIGRAFRGRALSQAHREKIGRANLGKKRSQATRDKMSSDRRGRPSTNFGRKCSQETLEKMRLSHLGKKLSVETRLKMSESQSKRRRDERIKEAQNGVA